MHLLNELSKGAVRYFDIAGEDSKHTKFVCKNCGIEGEHKTFEGPVQIVRSSLVRIIYIFLFTQIKCEVFNMWCTKRALDSRVSDQQDLVRSPIYNNSVC